MRVVVVGGGVAGLATAWAIRQEAARRARDVDVLVLEAGPRAGGRIRTTEEDGYLVEWAANGIQGTDGAAWRLAESVGLADERVIARPESARRYIAHGGRLHLLPLSPPALFRFGAISPWARLRVALEPFFARRVQTEESVHDYAARHVGEEAARVLIGSAVRGIFAGNAKQLSVDAAFPLMRRMERDHRSLVIAMIKRRKQGGGGPGGRTLWSLRHGIASLTDALAAKLGPAIRTDTPVLGLGPRPPFGYALRLASGEALEADAVVLATPARGAAALLKGIDPELARKVGTIEPAGLTVVGLAMKPEAFRTPPDGYGYLVAPDESLDILGALFESNLFPGRAPEGRVLVRVMIGGVDRPELITRSDADLIGLSMKALDRTHGLTSGPERTWVIRQEAAISQYPVGHAALLKELDQRLAALPGLQLTGNPYRGVSVAALIEDAERTATRVLGADGAARTAAAPAAAATATAR